MNPPYDPALQAVTGVAEVASVGGLESQVQIRLYPPLLAAAGLTLRDVMSAISLSLEETGGRTIDLTNREYQLRGRIGTATVDELERLVVGRDRGGRAVAVHELGYVQLGYDLRRGIADLDGTGEVVGGIAIMSQGENVLAVTRALDARVRALAETLPAGLRIVPTYERSELILADAARVLADLALRIAGDRRRWCCCSCAICARPSHRSLILVLALVVHGAANGHVRPDHQPAVTGGPCHRHGRDGRCDDCHRGELLG